MAPITRQDKDQRKCVSGDSAGLKRKAANIHKSFVTMLASNAFYTCSESPAQGKVWRRTRPDVSDTGSWRDASKTAGAIMQDIYLQTFWVHIDNRHYKMSKRWDKNCCFAKETKLKHFFLSFLTDIFTFVSAQRLVNTSSSHDGDSNNVQFKGAFHRRKTKSPPKNVDALPRGED